MTKSAKRVGVLTLSLPRERTDLAQAFGQAAAEALQARGFEVLTPADDLAFDTSQCLAAVRTFQENDADAVLILLGTWVFAPTVVDTMQACDLPFGIWAEDNPGSFSLTAGGIVHGSLDELGLPHRFFYGSPQSKSLIDEIAAFITGAACARALQGQRLCVVGGRVMGMYTTMVDIMQIKNLFGVEIEHIDTVRVYLAAEQLSPDAVAECRDWLAQTFGNILITDERLDKSIRLYLALKQILEADGYRLAAIKCQEEMINCYSSFCLATSLLNDAGLTLACESDVNAALTMRLLQTASGGIALFGDINHLDFEANALRIVNCGSMPTLMAESRKDVDLATQYEYMGDAPGATTVLAVKDAPVTLARLSRIKGKYVMVAVEGHSQPLPRERFKEAREFWPHAYIKLHCQAQNLIPLLRSNHMHACFGNHLSALKAFCALKGIECLQPE
ncbi:hypothetical protein GF339_14110 [candidate division KSB3 bacterium]|uniref:L-fucose isomerase C-terminal domain-containing protein n=1 Tax=candidate division KSB3 bacterium TaxID=2044937 RepID=A0A9D5JXE1_9BACT|nr:hypothetical protein [candidate division KSB3 bacterium]MBD3325716.1 hypothetical protein [candidate division KSB3 bacterium]